MSSKDPGIGSLINCEGGKNCMVQRILNEARVGTGSQRPSRTEALPVTAHREGSTVMLRRLLSLVKIEHTLFALPLAFTGSILAARGVPNLKRSGAGCPRICRGQNLGHGVQSFGGSPLGRSESADPVDREIPSGQINLFQAWALVVIAVGVYFLASLALNRVCFYLSPVALTILLAYSYSKRFTWLCHLFLGLCLGLAPVAGWLAVAGGVDWTPVVLGIGVLFWVAGFDVIYACQDVEFDRRVKLYSLPAWLGTRAVSALGRTRARCGHLPVYAGRQIGGPKLAVLSFEPGDLRIIVLGTQAAPSR